MIHEHPLKILKHANKSIWLLIFPVLRGVRSFTFDLASFYTWLAGVWFDLIVIILILAFGYFSWLFTWLEISESNIRLESGIFIKREKKLPVKNISAVTAQYSFFLAPFRAVIVNIDTEGGSFRHTDMSVLIRSNNLKKIRKNLPKMKEKEQKSFRFRSKWQQIVIFSFIFSSSLSGAVFLSALIFNAGKIIYDLMGEELDQMLKIANDFSENMYLATRFEIPAEIIILISVVLGTWLLSFILNLLRYSRFSMKKYSHIIRVTSGIFTKRVFHIVPEKINYLDLRQSFISKLFKVSSLNISCSGYGKNRIPVLLPVLTKTQADKALEITGFNKYLVKRRFKPQKRAVMSYLGIPLGFVAGIFILGRIAMILFPQISQIMLYSMITLEVPFVWLCLVKLYAFLTSGITVEKDFCCIRYSRFYEFHTILSDNRKLIRLQFSQSFFEKRAGRCRLEFYFYSESSRGHKIKGLSVEDAQKIMEQFSIFA